MLNKKWLAYSYSMLNVKKASIINCKSFYAIKGDAEAMRKERSKLMEMRKKEKKTLELLIKSESFGKDSIYQGQDYN